MALFSFSLFFPRDSTCNLLEAFPRRVSRKVYLSDLKLTTAGKKLQKHEVFCRDVSPFRCLRSCLEVWWVMTGYGKPIWFNGCFLFYSWEKAQIPCAFGRGVMKVGAAHLSHYLKQARRLLLPAGKQTRPGSGYCATGRLLFPLPISGDSEILFYPVSEHRVTFVTCMH